MDFKKSEAHVGYSIFETVEECYQYNENACFIAETRAAAKIFLRDGFADPKGCRIDAIRSGYIMQDYGASCGEYAMERGAFLRFKVAAEVNGIQFSAELYDEDDSLLVVEIDGVVTAGDDRSTANKEMQQTAGRRG